MFSTHHELYTSVPSIVSESAPHLAKPEGQVCTMPLAYHTPPQSPHAHQAQEPTSISARASILVQEHFMLLAICQKRTESVHACVASDLTFRIAMTVTLRVCWIDRGQPFRVFVSAAGSMRMKDESRRWTLDTTPSWNCVDDCVRPSMGAAFAESGVLGL